MNAPARIPLSAQVRLYEEAKADLMASHGLEADDPALPDSLDGCCDLPDTLAAMWRRARSLEADCEALVAQEKRLKARREGKLETIARIKARVAHYMSEAGMPSLERPDFRLGWRRNKAPLIVGDDVSADTLPDHVVKTIRQIDKTALREAVEAGEAFPGVHLGNPFRSLTVR